MVLVVPSHGPGGDDRTGEQDIGPTRLLPTKVRQLVTLEADTGMTTKTQESQLKTHIIIHYIGRIWL